ncbi:alpha-glucuronidase family glycosyl hydrolase [Pararcticibacter amylolyticus]|uniref:Xylan alpha-1,2-glucuronidase n=1 Tax=Pararcticibacter amylolyticus TaxID=2173175 RepID=A0A2U2PDC5_9SPHI|nr:alpha-glucuronidase family glycosyl hydrolase [Pararcticibacter amylolyticus]PWG79314.1 alpha-glucuronidase [Pararcticibacter amylolyticus]
MFRTTFRSTHLRIFSLLILLLLQAKTHAEDGYKLWLRYDRIQNKKTLSLYQDQLKQYTFMGSSATINAAKTELRNGLSSLLGKKIPETDAIKNNSIVVAPLSRLGANADKELRAQLRQLGKEGFIIKNITGGGKNYTLITANSDIGLLYGTFRFLQILASETSIARLSVSDFPRLQNRLLNHWDNPDGSIERGYAGRSIFEWNTLPGKISRRYIDYARANASVGINGTVLNNVNANPNILTPEYLVKVKALADAFRPYGIKVYVSVNFAAPIRIGKLATADPADPAVKQWWKKKADEIYQLIPDFGGFCVKANSEGQPGPQDYGRSHTDGANMLAEALAPHRGIVMWRAFVYKNREQDRIRESYDEFHPTNGKFASNVFLQVKNGPIDFQPREPFHPLFGAMDKTPLMLEVQLTQEYLGFSTHLVYLGPLFEECLQSDTYAKGQGTTVAKVIEGKVSPQKMTGIAGVANIGDARNWTAHPFAQANWYAFGRMSWNPELKASGVIREWNILTFGNNKVLLDGLQQITMQSREAAVNYMGPLGLTMLMDISHYRPAPWRRDKPAPTGTRESFHRADEKGIGFDRTAAGSDAVSQYAGALKERFNDIHTCPEKFLLWFHHADWDYKTSSGKTLWNELCYRYSAGVYTVRAMQNKWETLKTLVDPERFTLVKNLLTEQEKEAVIWRDACLLYFQTFSKRPIPAELEAPAHDLEYYKALKVSMN